MLLTTCTGGVSELDSAAVGVFVFFFFSFFIAGRYFRV
jgi:hypothetical protein